MVDKNKFINTDLNKFFFLKLQGKKKITICEKNFKSLFFEINEEIKSYSAEKKYPNLLTAYKKDYFNFNFDYYNFELTLYDCLFKKEKKIFSYEEIIDIYYHSIFINWKDLNTENINKKIFVNKLPNSAESIEFILNNTKNSKIIFVKRNLTGIMKSRTLAHMQTHNIKLDKFDDCFYAITKSDFFFKNFLYENKVKELKRKNKNRIFITSLENLIYKRKNEMYEICKFLNINYDHILLKPTHLSKNIDGISFQINDDQYKISKKSIFLITMLSENWKKTKNIDVIYLFKFWKEYLTSIYLKIKFKLKFTNFHFKL